MKFLNTGILVWIFTGCIAFACAEPGESGTAGIDCGDHGSEHDGHCHCEAGWLFDGATCVLPAEITEVCEADEHEEDAGAEAEHDDETSEETDHHHAACRCPEEGECHCEAGTLETFEGVEFCVPMLHE